uniref:Abnormal cell migration protein 18-like fibronectin type I domain-containing protein n=1 Tax=Acrobeloides nanus TaxID=290746 RepID=A0A914C135_9BILA
MKRFLGVFYFVSYLLAIINGFEVIDCDICHQSYVIPSSVAEKSGSEENTKSCIKNGNSIENAESYRHSHLRYRCENGIMRIEGCFVDENKDLEIGENFVDHDKNTAMKCYKKDGSIGYKEIFCGNTECAICEENTNLGKILTPNVKKAPTQESSAVSSNLNVNRCSKNGQFFSEGETYRHNNLRYKCENGIMRVKGCYAQNDKDLDAGQNFVDQDTKSIFQCQQLGSKIGFKAIFCSATGFNEDMTDCKGITTSQEKAYDTISHHKIYVVKTEEGEKVDEEKNMHVNCECE